MAWTVAEYDALKKAIATGQLEVQYADKRIRYQSTESMLMALREMEAELLGLGLITKPSTAKPDVSVTTFSRE